MKSQFLRILGMVGFIISIFTGNAQTTFKEFNHKGDFEFEFDADNNRIRNGIADSLDEDTFATPPFARFTIPTDFGGTVNSDSWMSQLSDNLSISNLNIPGTHDTMSYHQSGSLTSLYFNPDVVAFHTTHSANLRNQLDSGIRYIGIRIGNKDGIMTARHASSDMETRFDVILRVLKNFLDENPSETIFMRLKKEAFTDHTDNTFAFILESYIKGERHIEKNQ